MAIGSAPASNKSYTTPTDTTGYKTALISLMVLFFMMGFITCLNDILVPFLKKVFVLSYTEAALVQFCFFGAYFVMSVPSSLIVGKLGYKRGMVIGFVTAAAGCLLFLPAVSMHLYSVFLFALFILASGIVLLQVAANPYVAILGSPETASARLTLNQALNSMGTFLAPFFGSYFILSALEHATSAEAVEIPYAGLAGVLLLIAFVISRLKLPVIEAEEVEETLHEGQTKKTSAWQYKHLVFGAIAIFMYVGGEVAIGSYLVNYFGLSDVASLGEKDAAHLVAFYWGGAMVGRFLGAYFLAKMSPGKVLAFTALSVIVLVTVSIMSRGNVAMYTMISVGLFNSIMFPTIFTLAIKNLGKFTTQGAGILSTAIVGGALIPLLQGTLADMPSVTLRYAFIVPIVCYAYIVWFGLKGHKTDED